MPQGIDDKQRALAMLANCPNGATRDTLVKHGFTDATLAALVREKQLYRHIAVMANPKGLQVTWFHITDVGRAALTQEE